MLELYHDSLGVANKNNPRHRGTSKPYQHSDWSLDCHFIGSEDKAEVVGVNSNPEFQQDKLVSELDIWIIHHEVKRKNVKIIGISHRTLTILLTAFSSLGLLSLLGVARLWMTLEVNMTSSTDISSVFVTSTSAVVILTCSSSFASSADASSTYSVKHHMEKCAKLIYQTSLTKGNRRVRDVLTPLIVILNLVLQHATECW